MIEKDEQRFDLLKLEISIIAGKAKDAVDNLWRIRVYTYTFWIACIGAGLAGLSFKTGSKVLWPPIWLSLLPPIASAYIEATYHAWYRQLVMREVEIGKFINTKDYRTPEASSTVAPKDGKGTLHEFPLFDLDGCATFGKNHAWWKWEKSLLRSVSSYTPMLVYGSQLAGSATVIYTFGGDYGCYRVIPIAAVVLLLSGILVTSWIRKPNRRG